MLRFLIILILSLSITISKADNLKNDEENINVDKLLETMNTKGEKSEESYLKLIQNKEKVLSCLISIARDKKSKNYFMANLVIATMKDSKLDYVLEEQVDFLIEVAKDKKSKDHHIAIGILAGIKVPKAMDMMFHLISDSDKSVRMGAVLSLLNNNNNKIVPIAIKIAKDTKEETTFRMMCLHSLGKIGTVDVIESLFNFLSEINEKEGNSNRMIRATASVSILQATNKDTIPIFRKKLDSEKKEIKILAIRKLGDFKDNESISVLKKMLSDNDRDIQIAVADALNKITGENFKKKNVYTISIKKDGTIWIDEKEITKGDLENEIKSIASKKEIVESGTYRVKIVSPPRDEENSEIVMIVLDTMDILNKYFKENKKDLQIILASEVPKIQK